MKVQESLFIERLSREMKLRNYSLHTINNYSACLSKVEEFHQIPINEITVAQLKDYLYHRISHDKVSVSYVNQTISGYKIVQEDLLGKEWESIRIKRPRLPKKLPEVLRIDQVEQMIQLTGNIKHKALIALAYSSGLRLDETRRIKPADIDSITMRVKVRSGKGKKDRFTLLSTNALEFLRAYYKVERPVCYLFEPRGNKGNCLSSSTLNNIVKQAANRAEIRQDISFHTLRHCFATHLLEQGVNLKLIQQFMGHSSLKTTSIYFHVANIHPGAVLSPLDSMNL